MYGLLRLYSLIRKLFQRNIRKNISSDAHLPFITLKEPTYVYHSYHANQLTRFHLLNAWTWRRDGLQPNHGLVRIRL